MLHDGKIWIGSCGDGSPVYLLPSMANRHGLIAGATGTGKTITLKVLAESFSDCGVPVFFSDVKGDLAAMCNAGAPNENVQKRIDELVQEGDMILILGPEDIRELGNELCPEGK